MKYYYLVLLSTLFILSCTEDKYEKEKQINNNNESSYLKIEIIDFNLDSMDKMIKIRYPIITQYYKNHEEVFELDSIGTFQYRTDLRFPIQLTVSYNKMYSVILSPGDSLVVRINSKKTYSDLTETEKLKYENKFFYEKDIISFNGKGSETNNFNLDFIAECEKINPNYLETESMIKNSPNEYKKHVFDIEKKFFELLNKMKEKDNKPNSMYENAKRILKFQSYERLLYYSWYHPAMNGIEETEFELPVDYFDFLYSLNNIETNDYGYIKVCSFIHEYDNYVRSQTCYPHMNEYFQKNDYFNYYRLKIDSIGTVADKNYIQLLITRTLGEVLTNYGIEIFDSLFLFTKDFVSDEYLLSRINEIRNSINIKKLSKIKDYYEDKIIGQFFKSLERYQGSYIYIDFWATSCKPCLMEMENIEKLKNGLADVPMTYIYVCNDHGSEQWRKIVDEFHIKGEHLQISRDENLMLNKIFKIHGIPHYILIDTKGNIIDTNAPRPSGYNRLREIIANNEL